MPRIAIVAAALWDLRALCESQLRAITDAQKIIDHYRDTSHTQTDAKARLLQDLASVVQAHAAIVEALKGYECLVLQLPTEAVAGHPPVTQNRPR